MHILQLSWSNTVFARAESHQISKDCKTKHAVHMARDHFICSMHALSLLFFFVIERSMLMVLVFISKVCYKRKQHKEPSNFWAFVCYRQNPVKCSACAFAPEIETIVFVET